MVFVGGLDNSCTEEILFAAFIPFGDIKEVVLPRDYANSALFVTYFFKHIGFF